MSARHPAVRTYGAVQAMAPDFVGCKVLDDGRVILSGITWERLLMASLANASGRLMSSASVSTAVHSIARLCDEHDSPNVVGFDDAAAFLDRIAVDLDSAREPGMSAEDRREAASEQRAALRKDDQLAGSYQ